MMLSSATMLSFALFLAWYGLGGISMRLWARVAFGFTGAFGFLGFSVYVVRAVVAGRVGVRQHHLQVAGEGNRLRLVSPKRWGVVEVLSNLAFGVSGVVFSFGVWYDLFQPVLAPGQRLLFPPVVLVLGVGGFVAAYFGMTRLSRGLVVLSPSGVEVADFVQVRSLRWAEIVNVNPVSGKERRQARIAIELERDQMPPVTVQADALAIGAPAAFWLIDFYWRNPDSRWELATGRAAERLRDGSIVEEAERYVIADG